MSPTSELSAPNVAVAPVRLTDRRFVHTAARNGLLASSDALTLCLAVAVAYLAWAAPVRAQSARQYLELAPLVVLFLMGYGRAGLYPGFGLGAVEILRRLSSVTTFGYLLIAASVFAI